jgi:hypothetical protein
MSLPLSFHVPESPSRKPVILGLLAPPTSRPLLSPVRAPWLTKNSTQFAMEYENPDLTRPSVSSF